MKVSERRKEPKNWSEVISTISKKPRQFHMIKSNKEVTGKTRKSHFYRKPQKLKIAKVYLWRIFYFLGKSHSAEKTKSCQLLQN